jgi:hypothetical protein
MFKKLKEQVQERFKELYSESVGMLYHVEIDRDVIFEKYLEGFDDPIERQGHNCNCCKSFLRQFGSIVAIKDNKVMTLWDIQPDELFAKAVKNVRDYIVSLPITNVFYNDFEKLGTNQSPDGDVVWDHFFVKLPLNYVKHKDSIDTLKGQMRTKKETLKRSLEEIKPDAVSTVLELIAQNSLYRGKESETVLSAFEALQQIYNSVPAALRDNFCWACLSSRTGDMGGIRNSAIGTLLVDLSEGKDLNDAVGAFEAKVAPHNYKRPTALVSPRQVEDAKAKLEELGYMDSLERRFAQENELDSNRMLYIDKSTSLTNVFQEIAKDIEVNPRSLSKVEEVSIDDFVLNILTLNNLKEVHVLLENHHLPNMVTLLTTQHPEAKIMFKWDNPFSWAYTGGITDSIKERVKAAGGRVDGEIRISLSWSNYDDLDLHVIEPGGNHIYFGGRINPVTGGNLDVDMNAGGGRSKTPVENITWPGAQKMREGRYVVKVNNFAKREAEAQGFTVQIECRGEVYDLSFPSNSAVNKEIVQFDYTRANGLKMVGDVQSNLATKEKWNLKTNRFHKVKRVMTSPNMWNKPEGNKHAFFILENCASDEPTRPFFNEFLKEELTPHRRFFEILGSKLLVSPTTHQVAGLGFSETQRNHIFVRVRTNFERTIKVNF